MSKSKEIKNDQEARAALESYKNSGNAGSAGFAISYILDKVGGIASNKLTDPAEKFVVRAVEAAYCSILLDREIIGRMTGDDRAIKEVGETLKAVYGYHDPGKGEKALDEALRKLRNGLRSEPLMVEVFGKQKIV